MKGWIVAAVLVAGYAGLHRTGRRGGATAGELMSPMPGDELIASPKTRTDIYGRTIG